MAILTNPRLGVRMSRIVDLVYPVRCAGCGAFGHALCPDCRPSLVPATAVPHCRRCQAAVPAGLPEGCARCAGWTALDAAVTAYRLDGVARRLVHAYKYEFRASLAPALAAGIAPLGTASAFDLAYAVPLHPSRERYRGFNQAAKLLHELEWPAGPGSLRRVRNTARQVGQAVAERRQNVSGAFAYAGPSLAGRSVALIDDVLTTGATAEECARVLKANGAGRVTAVAYGRAGWKPEDHTGRVAD